MAILEGSQITVRVPGKYTWSCLFSRDQRGNTGTIVEKYRLNKSRHYSHSEFQDSLNQLHKNTKNVVSGKVTVGGTYDMISASAEVSASKETELNSFLSNRIKSKTDITEDGKSEFEETCGDVVEKWQKVFSCRGVIFSMEETSSHRGKDEEVTLLVVMKRLEYVSGIKVQYGNNKTDAPENRIRTRDGSGKIGDDINEGFGGDYVWLVPEYTHRAEDALTGIEVIIQGGSDGNLCDCAKGAGGDYRYIKGVKDPRVDRKITKVFLVRNGDRQAKLEDIPGAWGRSTDINHGRDGDYLHLLWL